MNPETETVLLAEQHEHTMRLTLNRPSRHHAINRALGDALAAAIDEAEANADVRVIVIYGSGERAFCAGQDMLEMNAAADGHDRPKTSSAAIAVARLAQTPLPVIAAVNGICYGGGALLAAAADIRLASDQATFRFPGAEYGLVVGAAWLPRLVGTSTAKEWIYTARKIDAAEARHAGFVSHVYKREALIDHAAELAHTIAQNSATAVQASKRVIDAATLVMAAEELESDFNTKFRGSEEQTARFDAATRRVTGKSG